LATISLVKNNPQDAEKLLAQQIEKSPNSPGLYQIQGELFLRSKKPELAEASFSRAVDLDRKSASALIRLGETQAVLNKWDKAIEVYKQAIELSPRDARLYVALGMLYEKSGNWQLARDTYQKGLSVQPDYPLAANNLAYLLLEHGGDPNVALALAQTARKGLPTLPNSADTLGWAYYETGAYSAAAPLFETAVNGRPNDQTYHFHLGLAYQKLHDNRAKAELEKAVSIDAKSSVADQARRALGGSAGS
jgi:tetratricopeptide (TPR) repeat protein